MHAPTFRSSAKLVSVLGVLVLACVGLRGATSKPAERTTVDFPMTRNSVVDGKYLKIGDLEVLANDKKPQTRVDGLIDPDVVKKCAEVGAQWVRLSADRTTIELESPWGNLETDRVLAAYCDDNVVMLGGFHQPTPSSPRSPWIFFSNLAPNHTPVRFMPTKTFSVGEWSHQVPYVLREVRTIDAASRRFVFAGSTKAGEQALLSAPFDILSDDTSSK